MNQIAAQLRESAARQRAGAALGAAVPLADELDQAAAEIEKLEKAIRRLAEQDATLSVCNGDVTVTMDAALTDAEREAIRSLAPSGDPLASRTVTLTPDVRRVLHGLLTRTGGTNG